MKRSYIAISLMILYGTTPLYSMELAKKKQKIHPGESSLSDTETQRGIGGLEEIEMSDIKGLSGDRVETQLLRKLLKKELRGYEKPDRKIMETLGAEIYKQNPTSYTSLTSVRTKKQRLKQKQKKQLYTLKEQVLKAYIESKKNEAKAANNNYQLQLQLAQEAREEAQWLHTFSYVSCAASLAISGSLALLGVIVSGISAGTSLYTAIECS